MKSKLLISALLLTRFFAAAQEPESAIDTLRSKAGQSDRNIMLNASSATVPREINIGLPESGNGAIVYVDGVKHALGLPRAQYHWAGGNAYVPVKTMNIIESLIYTGEIGIVVDSYTKTGGDTFEGRLSASTSSNGLIRFDGAVSGPIKKGWYYSGGVYVNLDPTDVNAPGRKFVENKQIFQLSVSKRWERSSLDMFYRFSRCRDNVNNGYKFAPFLYMGDGTIGNYNGFRIGRDCYMPADDEAKWLNVENGKMESGRLGKIDNRNIHDLTLKYDNRLQSGWDLAATFHLLRMCPGNYATFELASIKEGDYYLPDGTPYSKKAQNRIITVGNNHTTDLELLFEAKKDFGNHSLKSGLDFIYASQFMAGSTFNIAHTIEANPQRLSKGQDSSWDFNKNSLYMDGNKKNFAFYLMDNWQATRNLRLQTGIRLRPVFNTSICAPYDSETGANDRKTGDFSIVSENCKLTEKKINGLDYAVSECISYRLVGRLFANAEGFYSITNKVTTYFKGASSPSDKAIGNAYARGGLSYDNSWMDVAAVFSFITSWNNANVMNVTDPESGKVIPYTAQYGIRTLGVTIDGNLHFGGFKLHLLGTWQDPRYTNYKNVFEFESGTKVIDYTNNFVTGISRVMVEFDPSYSWSGYRIWASVRYYSRQYASRNNLAYFNGHFETFAGASAKIGKHNEISLNFVNMLNQNGAQGSVDIVDTIEDISLLNNYLIAGTYIRPFSIELSYTYSF